jgi:hypothetical protein
MKATCDRLWEVDALREGRLIGADAASSERHRASCNTCRDRFDADEHLRDLATSIQYPTMDMLRAKRLRARILRDVGQRPAATRRGWPFALAFAMVCLAVVGWRLTHRPSAPVAAAPAPGPARAGTIVPLADSIWSQTREGDVEHVRLERGELRVRVRKQAASERFFVELPDGRIEVRGTQFDVRVEGARTVGIIVSEGVVVFRARSQPEVMLAAGQSWPPPPAPRPSSTALPAPLELGSPRAPEPVDTTADDYDAAVRAYRQHDYDGAAERFERFAIAHPHARQSEDATFLHASALAFAGHDDAAATIAERFLKEYPRSIHARDAEELIARAARKNASPR